MLPETLASPRLRVRSETGLGASSGLSVQRTLRRGRLPPPAAAGETSGGHLTALGTP